MMVEFAMVNPLSFRHLRVFPCPNPKPSVSNSSERRAQSAGKSPARAVPKLERKHVQCVFIPSRYGNISKNIEKEKIAHQLNMFSQLFSQLVELLPQLVMFPASKKY